jgi:hypothetical protein
MDTTTIALGAFFGVFSFRWDRLRHAVPLGKALTARWHTLPVTPGGQAVPTMTLSPS